MANNFSEGVSLGGFSDCPESLQSRRDASFSPKQHSSLCLGQSPDTPHCSKMPTYMFCIWTILFPGEAVFSVVALLLDHEHIRIRLTGEEQVPHMEACPPCCLPGHQKCSRLPWSAAFMLAAG